jgi:hypothetical protein
MHDGPKLTKRLTMSRSDLFDLGLQRNSPARMATPEAVGGELPSKQFNSFFSDRFSYSIFHVTSYADYTGFIPDVN